MSRADSCSPEAGHGAAQHQAHSESKQQRDLKQVQQLALPQLPRNFPPRLLTEVLENDVHYPKKESHKLLFTIAAAGLSPEQDF